MRGAPPLRAVACAIPRASPPCTVGISTIPVAAAVPRTCLIGFLVVVVSARVHVALDIVVVGRVRVVVGRRRTLLRRRDDARVDALVVVGVAAAEAHAAHRAAAAAGRPPAARAVRRPVVVPALR